MILENRQELQDGFVLRPATGADKTAVLALINLVQPSLPWTSEHFDWQLLQGPAGPAEVRVIEIGGRIVSLYVGTRKRLWVDGATREAVMVQDVLTDPEFRWRGFLNRFAASFLDEIRAWGALGYTFPNKLSENSFRRSGWTELCGIPILVRPLAAHAGLPRSTEVSFREVDAFTPAIDEIWPQAGLGIGVLRDSAYLGWRYGRPETVYRRFRIDDDTGYLVLKLYRSGEQRVMHICDLVLRQVRLTISLAGDWLGPKDVERLAETAMAQENKSMRDGNTRYISLTDATRLAEQVLTAA